ncbi:MAG: hypothetical protein ACOC44_14180 [Promethearchaeia archaeon]
MSKKRKLKLKPVKKLISREIKFEDGMPEQVINVAHRFAFLTSEEHDVLLSIKKDQKIPLPENKLDETVQDLIKKGLLIEN